MSGDIGSGHNGQLLAIVQRVERLREEISGLNADVSDIYKEARGNGFDPKIIKRVVAHRAKDPQKVETEDELFAIYLAAVGDAP